ncbi:hypothetical protein [Streptomyces sp. NPDC048603]|uniref:hypothetical protein n=1 Tax=Streptomyces sp. NPDC048603 TaxID=3365577 RepID=UPI00370F8E92
MPRTSRTLRLALLTASTSLTVGGVLLPTAAFAAPAAPHAATAPAAAANDEDGFGSLTVFGEEDQSPQDESPQDEAPQDESPQDEAPQDEAPQDPSPSEETAPDDGIVPESYCNDPMAAPGLCVDGKPLPKGDGTVVVPQAPPDSGIVPDSYCNDPMAAPGLCVNGKPLPKGDGSVKVPQGTLIPSPTGSSTAELAV